MNQETPLLLVEVVKLTHKNKNEFRIGMNDLDPAKFGLLLVDILRHGAQALKCPEEAIWQWVDRSESIPPHR